MEELAQRYRENIDQISRHVLSNKDYDKLEEIRGNAYNKAKELNKLIDETLQTAEDVKNLGYEVNLKAVNTINEIASTTQEFIKDTSIFKFDKVKFESQEIGKIAFSLKSAFMDHPFVAILFVVLCFFIDWAVVLCLLVFFGRNEKEANIVVHSGRSM